VATKELALQVTNTDDAEAAQICTTTEDLEVINAINIMIKHYLKVLPL